MKIFFGVKGLVFCRWWKTNGPNAGWVRFSSPGTSAPGLPAVYIYPRPFLREERPPPPLAHSYTQLLLGLSLYIFSRLYFAFLASLSILFPAVFSGGVVRGEEERELVLWMPGLVCLIYAGHFFNLWLYNIRTWPSYSHLIVIIELFGNYRVIQFRICNCGGLIKDGLGLWEIMAEERFSTKRNFWETRG